MNAGGGCGRLIARISSPRDDRLGQNLTLAAQDPGSRVPKADTEASGQRVGATGNLRSVLRPVHGMPGAWLFIFTLPAPLVRR